MDYVAKWFYLTLGASLFCFGVWMFWRAGSSGGRLAMLPLLIVAAFLASLCLLRVVPPMIGAKFGSLIWPDEKPEAPEARIAPVEGMIKAGKGAEAKAALEEIVKANPDSRRAVLMLARLHIDSGGTEGKGEACSLLLWHLGRREGALSGDSETALLLADLLAESNLAAKATEVLESELRKGYCRAEESLLRRRLESLK